MRSGISSGLSIQHQFKVCRRKHNSHSKFREKNLPDVNPKFIFSSDVFALVTSAEIRKLRQEQPQNLATLCYKATERLVKAVDSSCRTAAEQHTVLNCVRLLTRIIPYIFEDSEWKDFFWSALPSSNEKDEPTPLAQSLLNAICVSLSSRNVHNSSTWFLLGSFVLS